jgi:mono/diheme cytochrome c family protein
LTSTAARVRGRVLFQEHCALCHGVRADGRGVRQRGLVGKPVDFTSQGWRRSADPEAVFAAIRDGKTGTSMASWKLLGDDAIADLTSYVVSVSVEGP